MRTVHASMTALRLPTHQQISLPISSFSSPLSHSFINELAFPNISGAICQNVVHAATNQNDHLLELWLLNISLFST